jgi:hypothetical protein
MSVRDSLITVATRGLKCGAKLDLGRGAFAFLALILAHCPKIVFGVLEEILRHDPIPGQSFGAGKGQITFIVSLEVLNIARVGAEWISLGGLRSSQHGVGHNFRILAALPGEHRRSFAGRIALNILREFEIARQTASMHFSSSATGVYSRVTTDDRY